ncbi:hypothetical protein KJ632_02850 [Patescibacteria group bacterium]|nr:hypothetical protein [Patescibacteria group bacterium]
MENQNNNDEFQGVVGEALEQGVSAAGIMELLDKLEKRKEGRKIQQSLVESLNLFLTTFDCAVKDQAYGVQEDKDWGEVVSDLFTKVPINDFLTKAKMGTGDAFTSVGPLPIVVSRLEEDLKRCGCVLEKEFYQMTLQQLVERLMGIYEEIGRVSVDRAEFNGMVKGLLGEDVEA